MVPATASITKGKEFILLLAGGTKKTQFDDIVKAKALAGELE